MVQVGKDNFDHRQHPHFLVLSGSALTQKKGKKALIYHERLCYSNKRRESICCCVAKDQHCSLSEAAHIGSFGTDFPSSVFNEIRALMDSVHFLKVAIFIGSESDLSLALSLTHTVTE